jgi:hypothetical protein
MRVRERERERERREEKKVIEDKRKEKGTGEN